jgi:hypothetical protein
MPPRQRRPDTRTGDRHTAKDVSARLAPDDFEALEAARKAQGISRRQAVITAIREWVSRHDPESEKDR